MRARQAVAMSPEECVPNIGLRGRRRRMTLGIFWFSVTAAVFGSLAVSHARTLLFLLVAPLAALASIYFFQAREKT
jgi:hypothetical protein